MGIKRFYVGGPVRYRRPWPGHSGALLPCRGRWPLSIPAELWAGDPDGSGVGAGSRFLLCRLAALCPNPCPLLHGGVPGSRQERARAGRGSRAAEAGDGGAHSRLSLSDSFRRQVLWKLMTAVKFGDTVSYQQLAALVGKGGAARAVGGAMRDNPVPIIIPCHRVILSSGKLGNYTGGAAVKEWLLAHEKRLKGKWAN
ncbi:methylated-DNA--protein-cysteine methyltransferase isoform X1 [Sminthopsis crassicaudata]|uniref:methylated-DNA--protein-cysteine methyltransferase isoform X1 n=1 Tax=Sminthopsis crassicaudata TaxID=9301 RepID=UPI003D6875F4